MEYRTIALQLDGKKAIATVLEKRIYLGITDVFRDDMISVLEKDVQHLIIDLNQVSVMNSAGLGVLIMAQDIIRKRNGSVKLVRPQPLMREIFDRMRLDTLFEIHDQMEEALQK
ncbi:MAG: STAS domain-containing protein [candidate division KSB1 bacterium]|nr:STAS domain-containing protein [candidate division KSB1 bacterium]MDZ7317790.1 STAS domain-containing protein [candidate division KSB1 bacterium]MDZ7341679.1 STAS domain-containing protein [candidate division KSB1 bacterium]